MPERIVSSEIYSAKEYYEHPVVARTISEFLGCEGENNLSLTSTDEGNLSKLEESFKCEYLAFQNTDVKERKGKPSATTIKNQVLPFVLQTNSFTEIFQSTWQKEAPGQESLPSDEIIPDRTLFVFDTEYSHKSFPGKVFSDQMGVFEMIEPTYEVLCQELRSYGIDFMVVMTGRGYHFITQVPHASEVMDKLIELGQFIEPSVRERQKAVPFYSKRDKPVPLKAEQAHKGSSLLSHFLVTDSINKIRQRSHIPIEISDIGTECVALDMTPGLIRNVDNGITGIPGSIYVKPLVKSDLFGEDVVNRTRILTRVVRRNPSGEIDGLPGLISSRQNFTKGVENLSRSGGIIPDGSERIKNLIAKYKASDLKKFHRALDEERGDSPSQWWKTYRNYNGIAGKDPRLSYALNNANDEMLKPDVLNYVLNTLYDKWGGRNDIRVAGHIRTFLRSVYEDPKFNWGNEFIRHYSAEQHATGWTAIILGQRFEAR